MWFIIQMPGWEMKRAVASHVQLQLSYASTQGKADSCLLRQVFALQSNCYFEIPDFWFIEARFSLIEVSFNP